MTFGLRRGPEFSQYQLKVDHWRCAGQKRTKIPQNMPQDRHKDTFPEHPLLLAKLAYRFQKLDKACC